MLSCWDRELELWLELGFSSEILSLGNSNDMTLFDWEL